MKKVVHVDGESYENLDKFMPCTLSVWYFNIKLHRSMLFFLLFLNIKLWGEVGLVQWSSTPVDIPHIKGTSLNSGILVCDYLVLFIVIVVYCTTSGIRVKRSIQINNYAKFGEYHLWSWDAQCQELLSLAEKDKRSFDSIRSLHGVIGKGAKRWTMMSGKRCLPRLPVRSIWICQLELFLMWLMNKRQTIWLKLKYVYGEKFDK